MFSEQKILWQTLIHSASLGYPMQLEFAKLLFDFLEIPIILYILYIGIVLTIGFGLLEIYISIGTKNNIFLNTDIGNTF